MVASAGAVVDRDATSATPGMFAEQRGSAFAARICALVSSPRAFCSSAIHGQTWAGSSSTWTPQ